MWAEELRTIDRLDQLEGQLVAESEKEDYVCQVFREEDLETRVQGTLREHIGAWENAGAGNFALNVIREGFRLNLQGTPGQYKEKNNRRYEVHKEFAVQAVLKLAKLKILQEVDRTEVDCVNPLTVAVRNGKK